MIRKQLICLNLALLLLAALAAPAAATFIEAPDWAEEEEELELIPYCPEEEPVLSKALDGVELPGPGPGRVETLGDSYAIAVGDAQFLSDEDASGDGWSYVAGTGLLTLDGYNGGAIRAEGGLHVSCSGSVSIRGASGSNEGEDGIQAAGILEVDVQEGGSLMIQAGNGADTGGDAISAGRLYLWCKAGAQANLLGGAAMGGESGICRGGNGINAGEYAYITGEGSIYALGANAYGSVQGSAGGFGIYADSMYMALSGTVGGGRGDVDGAGICFVSSGSTGQVNLRVIGGGESGPAFYSPDGAEWYYSSNTQVTGTEHELTISIKQYTLTLYGGDGVDAEGATFTSLTDYYPTEYELGEYVFQRDGYVQVAWIGDGYPEERPLAINSRFTPGESCALYALWAEAGPDGLVLNALDGQLDNGKFYQTLRGETVTLPEQASYWGMSNPILGWSTAPSVREGENAVFGGIWYAGGDSISPEETGIHALYAMKDGYGRYAVYHPTAGSIAGGGAVLIQGSVTTYTSLQAYALDGISWLTAPEDYVFAGWSKTENGTQVDMRSGSLVPFEPYVTLHYYAVWKPMEYVYEPQTGLTVTMIPAAKTVRVTLAPEWWREETETAFCALYDGAQMLECRVLEEGGETVELEFTYTGDQPPVCKVIALDGSQRPVGPCAEQTLVR